MSNSDSYAQAKPKQARRDRDRSDERRDRRKRRSDEKISKDIHRNSRKDSKALAKGQSGSGRDSSLNDYFNWNRYLGKEPTRKTLIFQIANAGMTSVLREDAPELTATSRSPRRRHLPIANTKRQLRDKKRETFASCKLNLEANVGIFRYRLPLSDGGTFQNPLHQIKSLSFSPSGLHGAAVSVRTPEGEAEEK